ncbi:MAG: hypothetical protein K0Q74_975 [Gammaproteobacteria bacterium]|jgi:hypothetical protein|nr:hypothetical protein [Gammaproteobacteria bacterium]
MAAEVTHSIIHFSNWSDTDRGFLDFFRHIFPYAIEANLAYRKDLEIQETMRVLIAELTDPLTLDDEIREPDKEYQDMHIQGPMHLHNSRQKLLS